MFPLVNYHNLETNTRSVACGGGVGIYVKQNLSYKILKQYSEQIFESLFIELSLANNKKIVIGSIYRPGTKYPGLTFTEQFAQFSKILCTLLADISNEYEHLRRF